MRPGVWMVVLGLMSGCLVGAPDMSSPGPHGAVVAAPLLESGTSFTFRTEGLYETDDQVVAVVAHSGPNGSLLASHTADDLVTEIVWDLFWLGAVDAGLNPVRRDGEGHIPLFDFPLVDGRTWAWGDHIVTANRNPVPVPGGMADGFQMTVEADRWTRTWTYAPEIGFLTSYRLDEGGTTYYDAELVAVGEASTWTWFEELDRWHPVRPAPEAPIATATFSPDAADAIALSAGARGGGRVLVQPPPGSDEDPWLFHAPGAETWTGALFAAEPGPWTVTGAAPAGGFGYAEAVAVRWITPATP